MEIKLGKITPYNEIFEDAFFSINGIAYSKSCITQFSINERSGLIELTIEIAERRFQEQLFNKASYLIQLDKEGINTIDHFFALYTVKDKNSYRDKTVTFIRRTSKQRMQAEVDMINWEKY